MKTISLLLLLFTLTLGGCKKTYICHCVDHMDYIDTRSFDVSGKNISMAEKECTAKKTSEEHCYLVP